MAVTFHWTEDRFLYVVERRDSRTEPHRELTAAERVAGWTAAPWAQRPGQPVPVYLPGHDHGALHTQTAPHVLQWAISPADRVLAVLVVTFEGTAAVRLNVDDEPEHGYYADRRYESARVDPCLVHGTILATVETHLNRAVFLGEDGAEDAFRPTGLEEQLQCALGNDWRAAPCSVQFVPVEDDDKPQRIRVQAAR